MPKYLITAPDGEKLEIDAPEGATEQDALEYVQQNYMPQEAASVDPEQVYAPNELPAPSIEDQRAAVGEGQHLRIGPFDTGYEMPQGVTEFLAGMGRRMTDIGTLGNRQPEPEADQLLDDSGYATAGSVMTDIGGMVAGGAGLKGASTLLSGMPKLAQAANYLGQGMMAPQKVSQAAAGMGLYSAATNEDRLASGAMGAAGGALGVAAPKLIGKAVKPAVSKAGQYLHDKGLTRLTPGQILGGSVKNTEEKLMSTPLVGGMIRDAQHGAQKQYMLSTVDDALKPIGRYLADDVAPGREAIHSAQSAISKEYDEVLTGMTVYADKPLQAELASLDQLIKALPRAEQHFFKTKIRDLIIDPFKKGNGVLLGKTYKEQDHLLRELYKKMQRGPGYQEMVGDAIRTAHQALRNAAARQNPVMASRLAGADTAYAKMKVIDRAASSLGAETGEFTPAQLLNSIKANTDMSTFAAGRGFNQSGAEMAKQALGSKIPNSGTADRAMLGALAAGSIPFSVPTAATLGAGMGAYSRPGLSALNKFYFNRPQGAGLVRELLEKGVAPKTGLLGGAYANSGDR